MTGRRGTAVAIALLVSAALAAAGCGLGPGKGLGDVTLTVTRDYGAHTLVGPLDDGVTESDTVMRVLDRNAKIETRYGGDFVQSIDGLAAVEEAGAGPTDWFFYVNGVESETGAADYPLHGGERIWWDYRDWSAAMRVPAVVGSWPQPFVDGYEGKRRPVAVECMGGGEACAVVRTRLEDAGATIATGSPAGAIRVLVGPWVEVRRDPAAAQIEDGPQASGVFADFPSPLSFAYTGKEPRKLRVAGSRRGREGCARLWARCRVGCRDPALRRAADLGRDRLDRRRGERRRRRSRRSRPARPLRGRRRGRERGGAAAAMRSPFAYTPRPGLLQAASPGAAVAYLGSLVLVAFLYSSPVVLVAAGVAVVLAGRIAGARDAVRAALRMGLALAVLIVAVNALVVSRGDTVLARLGDWPLLGRVDVTAEAIAAGAVLGLRAAVAMVAFAVYSSCVDPDRVLRALRPIAGRSALTATLVSRLVPVTAADATRLRDAGRLRGPGAAPVGRASAGPPPPRRLPGPRRRRRGDPRAARLRPRRAADAAADGDVPATTPASTPSAPR